MPMKNPPHPGRIVRKDCLEPLDLSVTTAAAALGVTRMALSNLVNEKSGISPEMAIRLEKMGWGSAESWANMQAVYQLAQARRNTEGIVVHPIDGEPVQSRTR